MPMKVAFFKSQGPIKDKIEPSVIKRWIKERKKLPKHRQ